MNGSGLNAIYTLFILMGLGVFLKKRGILNKSVESTMTRLISAYLVPAMMVYNVKNQFTKTFLIDNLTALAAVFVLISASVVLSLIVARIFRIEERREGIFAVMFSFSNSMFIGFPVVSGIFGDPGIPYLMLFYLINTTLFWTLGVYLVGKGGDHKLLSPSSLKKIFNPGFWGFMVGLVLLFLDIPVHPSVMKSLEYLSGMVTPLASIYMGSVAADIRLKDMLYIKDMLLVILGRFIVSPFLCLFICRLLGFPQLLTQVFVVISALPVMTNVSIVAGSYGKDSRFTAFMTALTTLLCIFALPFYFRFI